MTENTIDRPILADACPIWCDQHGTAHTEFCAGTEHEVRLSLMDWEIDEDGATEWPARVYPMQLINEVAAVCFVDTSGNTLTATPAEARKLAAALLNAADIADGGAS